MSEIVWALDNACDTCLMVHCTCFSEPAPEPVVEPEEQEELGDVDFEEETAPEKRIPQKKLNSGKTMKWSTSGQLTTVKTTADWMMYPEDKTSIDVFMDEVKKWSENLPGDSEETFSNAMVKYSELLVSHPEANNGYYMQAIKNQHIKNWQKRKVEEVTMAELPEANVEPNEINIAEWFNGLTRYQKKSVTELISQVLTNPDKPVSYELRRKVKDVPHP